MKKLMRNEKFERRNLHIKKRLQKPKAFGRFKGKYYEEIKLRPGRTQEQQKAMDFFNRYNEEQNTAQQQHEAFKANTKEYLLMISKVLN